VNAFHQLNDRIALVIGEKYREQSDLFPNADSGTLLHNSFGLAADELLTSESMNANVEQRNNLQQYIGEFPTFVKGESINQLRKKRKKTRKLRNRGGDVHLPVGTAALARPTPTPPRNQLVSVGTNSINSRFHRNGLDRMGMAMIKGEAICLDYEDDEDEVIIVDDDEHKVKTEVKMEIKTEVQNVGARAVVNRHTKAVKKYLLGTDVSPADPMKFAIYSEIIKGNPFALDVIETTAENDMTVKQTRDSLEGVLHLDIKDKNN
jgi:hypothetical protein